MSQADLSECTYHSCFVNFTTVHQISWVLPDFGNLFDLLSQYHIWKVASISFVVVVQSNFCHLGFVIDNKFSMGLRSG